TRIRFAWAPPASTSASRASAPGAMDPTRRLKLLTPNSIADGLISVVEFAVNKNYGAADGRGHPGTDEQRRAARAATADGGRAAGPARPRRSLDRGDRRSSRGLQGAALPLLPHQEGLRPCRPVPGPGGARRASAAGPRPRPRDPARPQPRRLSRLRRGARL